MALATSPTDPDRQWRPPDPPRELTGLVGVVTAYTLLLLVSALRGRPGQQRHGRRANNREDRTKP
jgi:hypothetical protein